MKYYMNKLCVILLTLLILVGFSSCETDENYYWKSGTLDIKFNLNIDHNGYGQAYTTVRITEIPQFNPSREDLIGIKTNDSWITISNLLRGDVINRFYIEVPGVGVYAYETPISIREDAAKIIIDDNAYFNFMRNVNELLYRNGAVDMKITFYSNIYDGGPAYFDISNNLDLEVRD